MRPKQKVLSRRILILVKVSALYSKAEREKAHRIVHRELSRGGLSPTFFSELFIHLSLFLGYPATLDGLESLAHGSPHRRSRTPKTRSSDADKHGKRILKRIYGQQTTKLLQHLDDLYPGLAKRITQDAYGLIMNRVGLTLPERELANVVVLYAHGFDRQLYSHLRGAVRVGINKNTLKTVILVTAKIIGKRSKQTLETIDRIRNA
jgi:4-carboxymuconolactone decarboxylase